MADLLNYKTLAISSLASSYTAGAGSFAVVGGEGTRFSAPSGGSFSYVMIRRGTTGYSYNLFKCTARSTDTFTATGGEDGTTDINLQAGDEVREVIPAVGLDQLRKDMNQYGTFANLPATCKIGDRYLTSDSPYEFLATAANTWTAFLQGRKVTVPTTAQFGTAVNSGSATMDAVHGGVHLNSPADSNNSFKIWVEAHSAGVTIDAMFTASMFPANYNAAGLVLRESGSGKLYVFIANFGIAASSMWQIGVTKYTNETTFSAAAYDPAAAWAGLAPNDPIHLRITDAVGGNVSFYICSGYHAQLVFTEARTTFMTSTGPNQRGITINPRNASYGVDMHLLDWTVA